MSFRARVLLLGALVALPLLLLAIVAAARDLAARQVDVEEEHVALTRTAALAAEGFLEGDAAAVRALATIPAVRDYTTRGDLTGPVMQSVFDASPNLETLALIGPDGWNVRSLTRTTDVPPRSVYVGDRPYVADALRTGQMVLSPGLLSRARPGVPTVAIAVPVATSGPETGSVVVGTIALGRLRDAMQAALRERELDVMLVDGDGQVLIAPGVDPDTARDLVSLRDQPPVAAALAGETGVWQGRLGGTGEDLMVGYAPAPGTNWGVLIQQPTALALEPARREAVRAVGLLALAMVLSLGLATFLATRLGRTLEQLEGARRAAERDRGRASFLAEATRQFASSLEYEATLDAVAHAAIPVLADWCMVDLVEDHDGGHMLRRVAIAHADPAKAEVAQALQQEYAPSYDAAAGAGRVVRTGEPLLVPDVSEVHRSSVAPTTRRLDLLRRLGAVSWLAVPIRGRTGVLGALTCLMADSGRKYGEDDLQLAQQLADRAALAVENAHLYREVQAAVRTRDEFLVAASHDLKSPLASVKVQAQMLGRKVQRDGAVSVTDVKSVADRIDATVTRAAAQVDELLDVARLQLGQPLPLERHPVDLAQLAREAVAEHGAGSERHRVQLETANGPVVGEWDARRLQRVLDNLLSNAIKYSPGGGDVLVHVAREDGPNGADARAVLTVQDAGVGIPSADLPRLFERFRRGTNVVGRFVGTGVGLASARHIVESHGGSIQIQSQEGQGTTVVVRLPLTEQRER